ncbi:hypothetical protein BDY19DRAFT_997487 [Irpex rosettiformis]|uniref:Uncharacterized protein n=1 Tax=Irpex rosettiformis TaxID=378272 RepID=A0ACB8TRT8_9APHY|nr:hypothetical protein BDY19DRAFT_997487 [Irpex rosettiformis]
MLLRWLLAICINTLISWTSAQSFNVPSTWQNATTSPLTRDDRLVIVEGLLNTVIRTFTPSGLAQGTVSSHPNWLISSIFKRKCYQGLGIPETAHLLHALATFDFINGTTANRDVVIDNLDSMFRLVPNITATSWGIAAINAYRAYQNDTLITYAQSMWKQGSAYMVTPEDAAAGTHPMKNVSIQATCNGQTTAGGVFSTSNVLNSTDVNGASTGSLFVLSARLYNHTLDPQYLSAAQLILNFTMNHLYNGNVILDSINLGSCAQEGVLVTQDSGWVVDGLSTLVVSTKDDSEISFLSNLVSTAIPNPAWTDAQNGIIIEGPINATDAASANSLFPLKGILIRGLYERYRTIPFDSPEATLIRSFITVQLNALLSRASTPGSNQYSPQWEGPPPQVLSPYGQLAAADVLFSAVGLLDTKNASATSPSGTPSSGETPITPGSTLPNANTTPPPHQRGISAGAIGGIAAGCALLLVLILIAVFVVHRRRKRRLEGEKMLTMETSARAYSASEERMFGREDDSGFLRVPQPVATKYARSQPSYTRSTPIPAYQPNPNTSTSNLTVTASTTTTSNNSNSNNPNSNNSNSNNSNSNNSNSNNSNSNNSNSNNPRPSHTTKPQHHAPSTTTGTSDVSSSSFILDLTSHPRLFARLTRAANAMESVGATRRTAGDSSRRGGGEEEEEDLPRYEG